MPVNELMVEPDKIALISGGGGATGSQQIGDFEILEKHNIVPDMGIVNSVGALNGGKFFADDFTARGLKNEWFNFKKPSEIFDLDPYQIAKSIFVETLTFFIGAVSRYLLLNQKTESAEQLARFAEKVLNSSGPSYKIQPLISIVAKIDAKHLTTLPQEFLVTVANNTPTRQLSKKVLFISNHDPEIIADPTKLMLFILASCAIPALFPLIPVHYRGEWHEFYDAGCLIPLPIFQAIRRGCNTIIVSRCHSDEDNSTLPRGNTRKLVTNMLEATKRLEKNEIKEAGRNPNINLFVLQSKIKFPKTYNTISFLPGDHEKARAHRREVAEETLSPLIEYFKQHPKNNPQSPNATDSPQANPA